MTKRFLPAAAFLLLLASLAPAAYGANPQDEKIPVKVTADSMVYDMNGDIVHILGNVKVVRGDFTMTSKKIDLFLTKNEVKQPQETELPLTGASSAGTSSASYLPTESISNSNIERIEATDDVKFKLEEQTGSSDKATYIAEQNLLILRGHAVVRDGKDFINADEIRYYIAEKRSEALGAQGKRVEAVFGSK
ncbi:MAG: hypothetical protein J5855_01620 [Mailhella sp.]|nr:hypothetical protein [Mailhella sp.]